MKLYNPNSKEGDIKGFLKDHPKNKVLEKAPKDETQKTLPIRDRGSTNLPVRSSTSKGS